MIREYHKYKDRRSASRIKPLAYLMVEFILFTLLSWLSYIFAPLWASVLVSVAALYFFLTNSLKRYKKVRERQHFYEDSKEG